MVTFAAAFPRSHVGADEPGFSLHATEFFPLAADPVQGYAVCRYDLAEGGRFVQRDPAGRQSDYRYGANRPTGATDPSGKYIVVTGGSDEVDKFEDWLGSHELNDFAGVWEAGGFTYRNPAGNPTPTGAWDIKTEIVWRMLISKSREFSFNRIEDLLLNIRQRGAFIDALEARRFSFGDVSTTCKTVLEDIEDKFGSKGFFRQARCSHTASLLMLRGGQLAEGLETFNARVLAAETKYSKKGVASREWDIVTKDLWPGHAAEDSDAGRVDWVPGDMGVIWNKDRSVASIIVSVHHWEAVLEAA